MPADYEQFDNIYHDLGKQPGICRIKSSGLGWRPIANKKDKDKENGAEVFTLGVTEFVQAHWSRAAKGYEMKIFTRNNGIVQFDGFEQDVCFAF